MSGPTGIVRFATSRKRYRTIDTLLADQLSALQNQIDQTEADRAWMNASLAAADGALLELDIRGTITGINPAARLLLGEVTGHSLSELCDVAEGLLSCAASAGFAVTELTGPDGVTLGLRLVPVAGGRGFVAALVRAEAKSAEQHAMAAAESWAPVMRAQVALDGVILKVSPQICLWSGRAEEELLSTPIVDFTHPDQRTETEENLARLAAGEVHHLEAERRYLGANGRDLWARVHVARVDGAPGQPDYLLVYLSDITAERKAQDAARRELARFRAMFEQNPAGTVILEPDGSISHWNPAALAMHGFGADQGPSFARNQLSGLFEAVDTEGRRLSAADWPLLRALRGEQVTALELRISRTDRPFAREIRYSAAPVYGPGGELLCALAVGHDLTAVREAERALAGSELRMKALLDSLPISVVMCHDREGRRMTVNAIHARHLRVTPETNISVQANGGRRPGYDVRVNGVSVPQEQTAPLWSARSGRASELAEHELVLPDGSSRYFYGLAIPFFDAHGEVTGSAAFFVDITERKRAEEALRASEARERQRAAELAALLDAMPAAVLIAHDRECRSVTGNRLAYAQFGAEAGSNLSTSHPEGDSAQAFDYYIDGAAAAPEWLPVERAARGERICGEEIEVGLRATGERRRLFGNAVPLLDESGAPRGAVAAFVDITAMRDAEAALAATLDRERARTEELEALLRVIPAAVFVAHDPQAQEVTGSIEAYRLAHMPIGSNISAAQPDRPTLELRVDGVTLPIAQMPVQRAARGEVVGQQELEVRFPDGQSRFLSGRAVPLFDAEGTPRGSVAAFVDITARKQAEEALRESEARERRQSAKLSTLLDAIPALVYIAHDPACRTVTGSRLAHELLGLPSVGEVGPEAESVPVLAPLRRALQGEAQPNEEYELALPGGEVRHFSGNAVPLRDELGVSWGAIAAFVDITARKEAERALRLSEIRERARAAEFATVFEWAPTPLYLARDPECRHIQANRAGHLLLGLPEETSNVSVSAVPREPWPLRFHQDGIELLPEELPMQRAAREGRSVQAELIEVLRPDGSVRMFSGTAIPVLDNEGQPGGAVGAFIDVTEQVAARHALVRQNESLERVNAELEEFAYAASHDLKAPLRAVAHLADWLIEELEQGIDEGNRERLLLLRARVVRMDRLINGLLAYARLGYRNPAEPEPVELSTLISELLSELALPAGFNVEITGELPVIEADPLHLRQLFQNLIENAVKHHDLPLGNVVVRAREEPERWLIEVADDGPGIPAENRRQVFKMFTTLRRRDETEHTGIGLALVQKIVSRYGAQVEIGENSPRGTVVVVQWPKA